MKKLAVFVLIIALVAIAAGCGKKSEESSSSAEVSIEPSVMQSKEVSSNSESSIASSAVENPPVIPPKPGSIIKVRETTSELSERYKSFYYKEYESWQEKQHKIGNYTVIEEDDVGVYLLDNSTKEKTLILENEEKGFNAPKRYTGVEVLDDTHFVFRYDTSDHIYDIKIRTKKLLDWKGAPLRYESFSNGKAYFEYSSSFDNPTKFDEFDMYGTVPTHNVYFEVDVSNYSIKEKSYDLKINRDGNSVAIRFSPNRKYASMLRVVGAEQTYNNPRNPTVVMLTIFELDTAKVISTRELSFKINYLSDEDAMGGAPFISEKSLCVYYGLIKNTKTRPIYEIDIA